MGIELPAELTDVATAAGVQWPQADETAMRATAQAWRQAGTQTTALAADADGAAGQALAVVHGAAGTAAGQHWHTFVAPDTGHLTSTAKGCLDAADRLDHAADQVGAAKVQIVRHLVTLAQHTDAANQAASAGHPLALAGLSTAVQSTAVNVAQVNHTLTNTIRLNPALPSTAAALSAPLTAAGPLGHALNAVAAPLTSQPIAHLATAAFQPAQPIRLTNPPAHGPISAIDSPVHGLIPAAGGPIPTAGNPITGPIAAGGGPILGHSPIDPGAHTPIDPGAHTPPMGVTVAQSAAPVAAPPIASAPQPATTTMGAPAVPAQPTGPAPTNWTAAPIGSPPPIAAQPTIGGPAASTGVAPPIAGSPTPVGAAQPVAATPAPIGTAQPVAGTPAPIGAQPANGDPEPAGGPASTGGPAISSGAPSAPPANRTAGVRKPVPTTGNLPPANPGVLPKPGPPQRDELALFLMYVFPVGHLPTASGTPRSRQLPPPPPDTDFAAGLRFPPHDHPESHLIDVRPPGRAVPPSAGTEFEAADYDPLGGEQENERDWDRRFLVRPAADDRPAEYAWPPGELCPEGGCTDGEPVVLAEGTVLDRFGTPEGRVFGADGTPFARRSLPPDHLCAGYRRYRVSAELPVWRTLSAPWFGQPGGGERYRAVYPAADLVALGYLSEIVDDDDGQ